MLMMFLFKIYHKTAHTGPGLKTGTKDDWYYYAPLGPYVPFYSEQMPNAGAYIIRALEAAPHRSPHVFCHTHAHNTHHTPHHKHTDHWVYEESLLTPYFRYYVSTHMCSYICWCVSCACVLACVCLFWCRWGPNPSIDPPPR